MSTKHLPKLVKRVYVEKGEGKTFNVVLVNTLGQTIKPCAPQPLREALTDASDWADFLGIKMDPYRIAGVPVAVVNRHTYDQAQVKTFDELHTAYRDPRTKELNFNKLMHYEWAQLRGIYRNKENLHQWVMPYHLEGRNNETEMELWLAANCDGSWSKVKGGWRFSSDRDAALFKLFFYGN